MKKLMIGLLSGLCVFTLVSIGITYVSIQNIKNNQNETGIDLYGTYNQNDLLIKKVTENYKGVEIEIPEIDGLKDVAVQKKVNQDMYNSVQEALKKYPEITYANYYVSANFANVISIGFYFGSETENKRAYMNYNLVDGERLKLEDLFVKDTDLTQIVRSAFYNKLTLDNFFDENESRIVSPDENELYKAVKAYMSTEDKLFYFSPAEIYFDSGNVMASVKMVDIAENVSIYTKYLTKNSLYRRDDIGFKNLFTCANGSYDIFEKIQYGYLEDNFWYDITVWRDYQTEEIEEEKRKPFEAFKERIYAEVDEKVREYRKIAKKNPDKFYILLSKPMINIYADSKYEDGTWKYIYSDLAMVIENVQIFEMPMEIYESVYKEKLIDTYRYEYFEMRGGAYLDPNAEEGADITRIEEQKLYNYISGEEITEFDI